MSNTEKTMQWSSKFKPTHLTVGTRVQLRNGAFTKIRMADEVGLITCGRHGAFDNCHRGNGAHYFGNPQYDIVKVHKAVKDKPLDLRKAVVGSRITFSSGQKAVVSGVGFYGHDAVFIAHDQLEVKAGWYYNISGERVGDADAPHIIQLKQPKKDSE